MLVECLIEREGPTEVNMHGRKYLFADDGTGAKVADVNTDEHREYLISTAFYRIYDPKIRAKVEKEKEARVKSTEEKAKQPDDVSPEVSIGLIVREFMPLTKENFAKWVGDNKEKILAMPVAAKDQVTSKWARLFPEVVCPVV